MSYTLIVLFSLLGVSLVTGFVAALLGKAIKYGETGHTVDTPEDFNADCAAFQEYKLWLDFKRERRRERLNNLAMYRWIGRPRS